MNNQPEIYKEVLLLIESISISQASIIPEEVINNIRKMSEGCSKEIKLKYDLNRKCYFI
ncbi:MAG: hypothetical protein IKM97_01810 [Clostridia bacterium]|nr:hypothetical protein [Clostridia bacterium]